MTPFQRLKATALLRLYTFTKIPLIWWVRPSIIEVGQKSVIEIKLGRRTQNHLGSMYFGALCMGGELVVAFKSVQTMTEKKVKVDFVFKDFKADFFRRADGNVHFVCTEGDRVEALLQKALDSTERVEDKFTSYAIVPSKSLTEKVAQFELTLSMKHRKKS